jgi:hypothetical protein
MSLIGHTPGEGYYSLVSSQQDLKNRECRARNVKDILRFLRRTLPVHLEYAQLCRYFPGQPKESFFKYLHKTVDLLKRRGLKGLTLENGLFYE